MTDTRPPSAVAVRPSCPTYRPVNAVTSIEGAQQRTPTEEETTPSRSQQRPPQQHTPSPTIGRETPPQRAPSPNIGRETPPSSPQQQHTPSPTVERETPPPPPSPSVERGTPPLSPQQQHTPSLTIERETLPPTPTIGPSPTADRVVPSPGLEQPYESSATVSREIRQRRNVQSLDTDDKLPPNSHNASRGNCNTALPGVQRASDRQKPLQEPRKRKASTSNVEASKRPCKADVSEVVRKLSENIRLGGQIYKDKDKRHGKLHSAFQNWEAELGVLRPDRRQMSLDCLMNQQGAYAEAVLCQGAVARMIHCWCAIAVDYRDGGHQAPEPLSQMTKKRELRARHYGYMIIEIINHLYNKEKCTDGSEGCANAYKVCSALAGKYVPNQEAISADIAQ